MTRWRIAASAAAVAGLLLAGCGGSTTRTASTHTTATATTVQTAASGATVLRRAVVAAIDADHATSNKALWTNTVPAKPVATAGPALSALRKSVAGRRAKGIRIRMLRDQLTVVSVQLAPSYTTATAVVRDAEKVQPAHKNGKLYGHTLSQTERATLKLHRVANTDRFVVWQVVSDK